MKGKKYLLFFVIFVLLLVGTSIFAVPKKNTVEAGMDERDRRAYGILEEKKNTVDVLVLGDSLCQTGISPFAMWETQGFTSYVCGQTAQRMWESYYMLKRALQNQKPKLVILETNLLFWPSETEGQINEALFECAGYYFPVFKYHNHWKTVSAELPEEAADENSRNYKGFHLKRDCVPYLAGKYMIETTETKGVPRVERFFLKQMIQLCRNREIEFMMVSLPSPKNCGYGTHNAVTALAEEHDVDYVDMNLLPEEIGIDWNKDILDGTEHLNVYGAEKVSAYLGEYLAEKYDLPDHREEEQYDSWDTAYAEYADYVEDMPE